MAVEAYRSGPDVSLSMAVHAFGGDMSPCEREGCEVVVKASLSRAGGMACKACCILVDVASDLVVLFIHICLVMFVADRATID
jgi:hypothetical protein